jgi:menaquinone-specific isochorismate synthase
MNEVVNQGPVSIRHGAHLPHWSRAGAIYFVTFRLADSVPGPVLEKWYWERKDAARAIAGSTGPVSRADLARWEQLNSERIEAYLNSGSGECLMKDDRVAGIVTSAIRHFDGTRYEIVSLCVMPNHVHVLVRPAEGGKLADIVHSWKSFTAKEINKVLGRSGRLWQEEYYDHLVRDEGDLRSCMEYIADNPQSAGLRDWKWVWTL